MVNWVYYWRIKHTSLLVAAALSFELGAVTSANSHPVTPFAWFGTGEGCWSPETTINKTS